LPTRLTQARRSQAKAGNLVNSVPTIPRTHPRCPVCGAAVTTGSTYCAKCVPAVNRENLLRQARLGRIATHTAIAEARRAANHAKQVEALRRWNPSDLPKWFDEDFYRREVLPRLSTFTVKKIRMRWTFLTPMRRSFGAEYASLILGTGCRWQSSRVSATRQELSGQQSLQLRVLRLSLLQDGDVRDGGASCPRPFAWPLRIYSYSSAVAIGAESEPPVISTLPF